MLLIAVIYEVYLHFLNVCLFFLFHFYCWGWEGWARKPVSHTSLVNVITQTDRPTLGLRYLCN